MTSNSTPYISEAFITKANRFIQKTQEHALQGVNPGGVYQATWCRDASYILRDWFLSGNIDGVCQQIYQIWSHQISQDKEKLVYGRGSPEMKFLSEVASVGKQKEFEGALPTTIYQAGFSEIYGQNPDIDSTALMVSTSSWILTRSLLKDEQEHSSENSSFPPPPTIASEHSSDYVSALLSKIGITNPSEVIKLVVPRMIRAIEYLNSRDIDNDGLLEQNHNEDWMDTILRAGKIVYDQACWILALNNLSTLLSKLGRDKEADRLVQLADKTIHAVDQKLWSEEDGCYIDIQESHHIGGPYRTLTQDVSFYLVAITENTVNDNFRIHDQHKKKQQQEPKKTIHQNLQRRAISSLDAIRSRVWKDKWPLVTEAELKSTGPWLLKPYQYHNQTFWPWTTGIEMLARSRFNRIEECDILLSKLASEEHPHIHTFYEWINPITDQGNGAYPFRTGISTVRIAIADILIRQNSLPPQTTTET
jgi:Glycosyl-hydrolase family 116, catalytic region